MASSSATTTILPPRPLPPPISGPLWMDRRAHADEIMGRYGEYGEDSEGCGRRWKAVESPADVVIEHADDSADAAE